MTTATATALPDLPGNKPETTSPSAAPGKPARTKYLLGGLVGAALLAAGTAYVLGLGKETTDDAQVEGRVIVMSARIPGQVLHVLVHDNQLVEAGEVIVELDPSDYSARLEAAGADLESAQAGAENARAALGLTEKTIDATFIQARGGITQASSSLSSARASIEQAEADLASAVSRARLAELSLGRAQSLFAQGAVPQAEVDIREAE